MRLFVIISFVFILIFSAFLPILLSTKSGSDFLTATLNKVIEGRVEVESLDLHWFGTQKATSLKYKNKEGTLTFNLDQFSTKTPLALLLFARHITGESHLETFSLTYLQDDESNQPLVFPIKKISGPLYINNGLITLEKKGVASSYVKNITVAINPEENHFYIQAEAIQMPHQGIFLAEGTLGPETKIVATLTHFPLTFLSLFEQTKWIPEALGPEISGEISLEREGSVLKLATIMNSLNLHVNIKGQGENRRFTLFQDSTAELTVTPSFFKTLFSLSNDSTLLLANNVNIRLNIENLDLPLSLKELTLDKITTAASFYTTPATLIYHDKSYLFDTIKGSMEKNDSLIVKYEAFMQSPNATTLTGSFIENQSGELFLTTTIEKMPTLFLETLFDIKGITTTFGENVKITIDGTRREKLVEADFAVTTENAKVIGHIKGSTLEKLSLSLAADLPFSETKKELFGERLTVEMKGQIAIIEGLFSHAIIHGRAANPYLNAELRGTFGKEGKAFSWDLVELILTGSIDSPPLFVTSGVAELMQEHPFYLHLEGAKEELLFDIDLTLLKAKGKIFNFIDEGALNFKQANWSVESSGREFPVSLIHAFSPRLSSLPELIGPYITFKTTIHHDPSKELHTDIDFDLTSEALYAKASLQIDDTLLLSRTTPTLLHYDLTKERYRALLKAWPKNELPPFLLGENSTLDFTITQLTCPKSSFTTVQEFICKSGFVGSLTISPLTFINEKENKKFTIEEINAKIEGENLSKALSFTFTGLLKEQEKSAKIALFGELLNLFNDEGNFDQIHGEIKSNITLEPMATEFVLGIIPIKNETRSLATALLGEEFSAEAAIDIKEHNGPLILNIDSSNFKAYCPFYFTKENKLLLTASLDAEILLTHQINETIIKDINPILISGLYSDHPLRLHIDPTNFSLSLFPFNFREILIEKAYIDIGQIEVVYGGEIQKTMEFLKAKDLSEEHTMPAWFTPLYFQLNDGNLEYQRFDLLLAGNIHLAFWGKIDLNKDKVRMTMAISPETLQRSFGIKGLTSKQMFHVKMRGSTSNLDLDWSAATRRLGIIIASSAGGQIGSLVGSLVEQIVTSLGEKPTPAPTTDPLPWVK